MRTTLGENGSIWVIGQLWFDRWFGQGKAGFQNETCPHKCPAKGGESVWLSLEGSKARLARSPLY